MLPKKQKLWDSSTQNTKTEFKPQQIRLTILQDSQTSDARNPTPSLSTLASGIFRNNPFTFHGRRGRSVHPTRLGNGQLPTNVQQLMNPNPITLPLVCRVAVILIFASLHVLFQLPALAQPSDVPLTRFWRLDGPVQAIVITNATTYVGGAFSYVGPDSGGAGVISVATGQAKRGFPKIEGSVLAAVPDGSGGWFVGGSFTNIGGTVRTNLAHVRADNVVNPSWSPNPNGQCRVLLVHNGVLYVGGNFTRLGGIIRNRIGAIDLATGEPTAWDPNASQFVNTFALKPTLNTLYVGGNFTTIGSSNRTRIAEVDLETGRATAWNPGSSHVVATIAVSGDTIYAGGGFTTIGGQPRNRIAALSANSDTALPWNPNILGGGVSNIVVGAGVLYAGGNFTTVSGLGRASLAAIDLTTGLPTAWDALPNTNVNTLILSGNVLYAGGGFTQIGGASRQYSAALDVTSGAALPWAPAASDLDQGIPASVFEMRLAGDEVFVGGSFASIGGAVRNNIAAIDNNSGEATAWNPNANGSVLALIAAGETLYAGGSFTNIGGQPRNRLAAISTQTGLASAWNPDVRGRAGVAVLDMAITEDVLFVGGINTTNVGAQPRTNLFAVQLANGQPTSWNPPVFRTSTAGAVSRLVVDGDSLVIGGDFSTVNGAFRTNLAALSMIDAAVEAWSPNPNGGVSNLVVSGDVVYAGGAFSSIGSILRNRIAAVERGSGLGILSWNPDAGSVAATRVYALLRGTSALYVGGTFNGLGGAFRTNSGSVTLYDGGLSGQAGSWNPRFGAAVRSMALGDNLLVTGGNFLSVGGSPISYLAAFDAAPGIVVSSMRTSPGAFQFDVRGGEATNIVVQRSISDLSHWTSISTNSVTPTAIPINDADPSEVTPRFYRAFAAP